MFEVRCLVADKRLAEVLRALRKLTLEPPVTIAVDEPQANGATPPSPKRTSGVRSAAKEFIERMIKSGAREITATQLREHMVASGFSERAYSYPLARLIKEKVLRPSKKYGVYEVING